MTVGPTAVVVVVTGLVAVVVVVVAAVLLFLALAEVVVVGELPLPPQVYSGGSWNLICSLRLGSRGVDVEVNCRLNQ